MRLQEGSRLGPYEILGPVGAGGMGEVYRARDPRLDREVAIKVLPEPDSKDPDRLRRFSREARAVAALSHPNILAIFDVGIGAVPFLVTELLTGETLRSLLARGPLGPRRTLQLSLQLVGGLVAAHSRDIVHRDLKPENLFVTEEGRLKILDFGLARHSAAADEGSLTGERTTPGTVVGTLAYMAPEQLRGFDADARADIFACGAVMFEMATGTRAFGGASPADTITAVLTEPPSALRFGPDTPPGLVSIIRRCLEKDPRHRFQSAVELGSVLESLSDVRSATTLPAARPTAASIAVLPFANMSADPDNQYFSDGLAEELIDALTRVSGRRVASRTSSFRFRDPDRDIRQIGRELGVDTILEGSVRRSGSRLRITLRLTNTADGYAHWSGKYDRQMKDIFDVQDEIVAAVTEALGPALGGGSRGRLHRPTENLEAYELYLRGRYFWNQRSPAVVGTAIRYFEEAIALDPEYALAYAGLADSYSILRVYGWTPAEHSRPRALGAISRALELGPELAEVHFSRALYTFHFERKWRAAREHFLQALSINPQNAMFEAYYGLFLATEYAYAEARRHLDHAIDLDPHSSVVHFLAASAACAMGDGAGAARHSARSLELQPESLGARWPETVAYVMTDRHDEAVAAAERFIARTRAPVYLGVLGMVYGCTGRLDAARRLLDELTERQGRGEYIVPVARLSVFLGLGDLGGIRSSLAGCVDGGAAPFSVVSTNRWLLESYRGDEQISTLLDRLHDGARP